MVVVVVVLVVSSSHDNITTATKTVVLDTSARNCVTMLATDIPLFSLGVYQRYTRDLSTQLRGPWCLGLRDPKLRP